MSETKFTPGPWEIEKSGSSSTGSVHYAVKTAYKPEEHPHSPRFIVFMCGGLGDFHPSRAMNDYRRDPQIEADAHLIAAAPELYTSLREILSLAREWGKNPKYYTQAERNIIGFAEDAIAKAEGKGV